MDEELKRLQKRNRLLLGKIAGVAEMSYQIRNMQEISAQQMANLLNAACYTLDLPDSWWTEREFKSIDTMIYDAIQTYIASGLRRL